MKRIFDTQWPAIFWSVIIFLLLAMPATGIKKETLPELPQADKIVHAFLFFVFVYVWSLAFTEKTAPGKRAIYVYTTLIGSGYGILMEYVQLLTGRDFETGDMIADAAGAFLALLFLLIKR